ncbi:MAG TPA: DUF58 domain-containing protein [Gemmatimonadaceae bacterium]|nr:DUF58 domain-containing protein [Gemmatimonadaceae bacterium]
MSVSPLLDPAVLARIGDLELVARTVVDGFVAGLHRSPNLGVSTDFAEHRAYAPGDDVRRVDWKLYARTDRYYVKEFEAETNASVSVLLDVSRSMSYRTGGVSKLDYARVLAACLLYFSQRQRDRVGLTTFDAHVVEHVPAAVRHLPLALHALGRAVARREGDVPAALQEIAPSYRRRGILVLVSDLYVEPDALLRGLEAVRGAGSEIVVMHVLDPAELDFPFEAPASFKDMEGDDALPVLPPAARERYRALLDGHVRTLRRRVGEAGMDYVLLDTRRPLDEALFEYLALRERLANLGTRA